MDDQISVRAQSWILVPGEQGPVMPKKHFTTVCAHLDGNSHSENQYIQVFKCKLEHLINKQESCKKCRTLTLSVLFY